MIFEQLIDRDLFNSIKQAPTWAVTIRLAPIKGCTNQGIEW